MENLQRQYKRNKILFFPGFLVSVMGSALFSFTTGLYLLETTEKSFFYALNILFFNVPLIFFGPLLGSLADRFCKKKLVVFGDMLNAILMIMIYFFWESIDRKTLIYMGTFLSSIFSTAVSISLSTGVPKFFGKEWIVQANSLSQIINSLAKIMGPFLGGLIYGLGNIKYFILFNGLSFLVSMFSELFLVTEVEKNKKSEKKQRMRDGFEYLKANRELKMFMVKFALINFAAITAIVVPVPYIINRVFHLGSRNLGMIQGTLPLGAIVGAILVNKKNFTLNKKSFIGIFTMFLMACIALYLTMFASTKSRMVPYVLALAMSGSGMAFAILDVTANTYFQETIPENIRGKIIGMITGIVKFTMPLAFIISGKITDTYSPFKSILLGGVIIFLTLITFSMINMIEEKTK